MALAPSFGSAQTGPTWSTFHAVNARTGVLNVNGPTSAGIANKWTLSKPIESSPVVDSSGTAYVGSDDGHVYAFSPSAPYGPKWAFPSLPNVQGTPTPGPAPTATTGGTGASGTAPVVAPPTLSPDGKTLYVASTDGNVYALNTSDGSQKWAASIGGYLRGSPLLSTDGSLLYEPQPFGGFKTITTSSGAIAQTTLINGSIAGSLASSPDGTVVYVATNNDYVYGVSAPTASNKGQLSPFYLDGEAFATPAVDANGNIYVTTNLGSLDSFAPSSSAPRWIFSTASHTASGSTPAIFNGIAYFGAGDGNLYAINASNGQQVWSAHTGGNVGSSAAVASGNSMLYVGSEDGNVYALNATTGAYVWSRGTGAAITSSPALGPDGSLWVASTSGELFRFQSIPVPAPPSGPPAKATSTTVPVGPVPTATAGPTQIPAPTATITLKARVKAGSKQVIKVTTTANAQIRFRINYPNGDHQSHRGTTKANGALTYKYTQGSSKIFHNRKYATVLITLPGGTTLTKQYKILLGKIDAAVQPRVQSVGHRVQVWVHTSRRTRVVAFLLFPNGRLHKLNGRTGPKGWVHIGYKIGRGMTSGRNHRVTVIARVFNHPSIATRTSFRIK